MPLYCIYIKLTLCASRTKYKLRGKIIFMLRPCFVVFYGPVAGINTRSEGWQGLPVPATIPLAARVGAGWSDYGRSGSDFEKTRGGAFASGTVIRSMSRILGSGMSGQNHAEQTHPLVMVVDDDWMNREVLEAYLVDAGCEVVLAHSGEVALQMTQETIPDLVLLDINLPGMTGYEVCARLKSDERTQFTPVVMVTALETDDDKIKAIQAGADDFLTKPFNSLLMMTRIRSLLRIKQLHDELESRNSLLRRILKRYVNEDIVDVILVDPDRYLKLGGETRAVTVFFADIRGFTAFAEHRPASEVLQTLNRIFNELTEVIFRHHGTFDKYIGDELMAFFGAPVATGDDALNALRAAQGMQVAFRQVCEAIGLPARRELGLGIGLHSGEAAVGNVGSERVMSYTVIGDVVNTARRIQQAAASGQVLISEATYQLAAPVLQAERLEARLFSGKSEPIVVYALHGIRV